MNNKKKSDDKLNAYLEVKNNFLNLIKIDPLFNDEKSLTKLHKALEFGESKHEGQLRKNISHPYFIHCLRVATNLLQEEDRNIDLVIAGLLHDTVEDTDTTIDELAKTFNKEVANLVEGMTKLPNSYKQEWGKERYYKEGFFGRLEKAAGKDPRVWKIKLSDRSDNLNDYYKFQSNSKIKDYMWETNKLLGFVKQYKLTSPLINTLKDQMKFYETFLAEKEQK